MTLQRIRIGLFVALSAVILSACNFSVSTANIQDVVLATSADASAETSTFQPTDTIFALVDLANAPDSTTIKAIWTAVDVGSAAPANQLIDETTLEAGSGVHQFSLAPSAPFPAGSYKVDIYLNDELNQTKAFTVAGDVAGGSAPTPNTVSDTSVDAPNSAETESPAVTDLQTVRAATVRIEAQGSFVHPEYGQVENIAGQGSGFIIDPSGIAVTNNHVVTGAAFLNVYLDGEEQPRNARVLGVSECSDLAVIDIDGDGFATLDWHTGPTSVGLDMYLAGFPLAGNTEYTLNRGIVSKENANGETIWSSVDAVIEYDATSNGGNSGGPVVTEDGQVIAVHYAGSRESRQAFGISSDIARGVVEQLRQGIDVDSIGINGRAIANEDGSIFGVWVSSVESGSPADEAGVRGGDIITHLEGLRLATDGSMSDYCDILRSRNTDDTMSIEVLRLATGEYLVGQLNGEELALAETIAVGGDVAQSESYSGYQTVTDDTGLLQVEVPTAWGQLQGDGWFIDNQQVGPGLFVSTDLNGLLSDWVTPGIFFGASDNTELLSDPSVLLDWYGVADSCTYDGRYEYSDAVYSGAYDLYTNCDGGSTSYVVLVTVPQDGSYVTLLLAQIATSADEEALGRVLDSFIVSQ